MTLYINSPEWFEGIDSTIELLSLIVAFTVSLYAYKAYKVTKQKNYFYFSASFFLISLSYIFKIISELVVYSKYIEQSIIGPFIVSKTVIVPVTWLHTYPHTTFKILLTFALFILLAVTFRIRTKSLLILLTYFMASTTLLSNYLPFTFHLTHVVILSLLTFHFYHNYLKQKTRQSLAVTLAFFSILVSHILFSFMAYDPNIYALGEVFHLLGFSSLLYAFILVKKR